MKIIKIDTLVKIDSANHIEIKAIVEPVLQKLIDDLKNMNEDVQIELNHLITIEKVNANETIETLKRELLKTLHEVSKDTKNIE